MPSTPRPPATARVLVPAGLAVLGIIGLALALMILVGMISRWTFEQWQTPDQLVISGGLILAAGFGLFFWRWERSSVPLALLPLGVSVVFAAGISFLFLDRVTWAWIDLGAVIVLGGSGLLGLLLASDRDLRET